MRSIIFISILISVFYLPMSLSKSVSEDYDPFVAGPFPVNHTSYLSPLTLFLDTNLDVYAPNAPGAFPVFYFITGLGGIIPSLAYSKFLTQIASHGIVAVGVWQLESPINSFNASWMDATVNFVETRLERNLRNNGYPSNFYIDFHNSFVSGHSAGGHVPVAQLEAHCLHFRGQVLLSPVDGADPFGYIPIAVITPGEKVNFTIPTLQVVVGYDNVVGPTTVACAPDVLSGHRFYDAMNGPTWYVNATEFGHADILDDPYELIVEITQFCVTMHDPPKEPYRNFVAGAIVSFIRAIIDPVDSCYLLDNLETSGILGVQTENEFQDNGWQRCTPTRCSIKNPDQ